MQNSIQTPSTGVRELVGSEVDAVSGGLDLSFADSPYFRAAATIVGIGVGYVAGKIWDWLFD